MWCHYIIEKGSDPFSLRRVVRFEGCGVWVTPT